MIFSGPPKTNCFKSGLLRYISKYFFNTVLKALDLYEGIHTYKYKDKLLMSCRKRPSSESFLKSIYFLKGLGTKGLGTVATPCCDVFQTLRL